MRQIIGPEHSPLRKLGDNERLEMALRLTLSKRDDVITLFQLYIPEKDGENPIWLNLLGIVHAIPENGHYNMGIAHGYYLKAAEKGFHAAQYNLGMIWFKGTLGEISLPRARYWFQQASDQGHHGAKAILFEFLEHDPKFKTDKEFRSAAVEMLRQSKDQGAMPAMLTYARTQVGTPNYREAIELYHKLLDYPGNIRPGQVAAMILAFRHFVGHEVQYSPAMAEKYTQAVLPFLGSETYESDRFLMRRLAWIIQNRPTYQADFDLIRALYEGRRNHDDVIAEINAKKITVTESLMNLCWAARHLAKLEHTDGEKWRSLYRALEVAGFGLNDEEIRKSTLEIGWQYNRLNERGYPIPGLMVEQKNLNEPYVGRFSSLSWPRLQPQFDGDRTLPHFIDRYDFDVILALAFRGEKMQWPHFSLEPRTFGKIDQIDSLFSQKVFYPRWLANTNIGRTFYWTDYIVGGLAFGTTGLYVQRAWMEKYPPEVQRFFEALNCAGGQDAGLASRVEIMPAQVSWKRKNRILGLYRDCAVTDVRMKIEGSQIHVADDGTQDRTRYRDQNNFTGGQVAAVLTQNYDLMARTWPVFERLRQINALLYACGDLRAQGYCLKRSEQEDFAKLTVDYGGRRRSLSQTLSLEP